MHPRTQGPHYQLNPLDYYLLKTVFIGSGHQRSSFIAPSHLSHLSRLSHLSHLSAYLYVLSSSLSPWSTNLGGRLNVTRPLYQWLWLGFLIYLSVYSIWFSSTHDTLQVSDSYQNNLILLLQTEGTERVSKRVTIGWKDEKSDAKRGLLFTRVGFMSKTWLWDGTWAARFSL